MSCSPTAFVVPIPGPTGEAGATGTDGADGQPAFTTTTANFTMPAADGLSTVVASVVNSDWAVIGSVVAVSLGGVYGDFQVTAKPTSTSITLLNLADGTNYPDNSAPGTVFTSGALVGASGRQGVTSVVPTGYLLAAENLGDVGNVVLARVNLGLQTAAFKNTGTTNNTIPVIDTTWTTGDLAVATATGIATQTAAATRTALGLVIGTNVQAYDATLQSISSLGTIADRFAYTTGVDTWAEAAVTSFARTLLDDNDAATMRSTLGIGASTALALLIYKHEASDGSAGGTFTADGSFKTVPINTEVVDTGNNGSIAGNQMTLAAGTYRYRYGVLGNRVDQFQAQLYDTTATAVIADSYGSVGYSANGTADNPGWSLGQGRFVLGVSSALELQARATTTKAGDGFGVAASFGVGEVYSWIELEKEA